jgi:hypothetical protein
MIMLTVGLTIKCMYFTLCYFEHLQIHLQASASGLSKLCDWRVYLMFKSVVSTATERVNFAWWFQS